MCNAGPDGFCSVVDALSILSWNVHGLLALKLWNSDFRANLFAEAHDIIALQECHLRPEQHENLRIPDDYECFSLSRQCSERLGHSGGGVLTLVKRALRARRVPCGAEADVVAVEVGNLTVVNIYFAPQESSWHDRLTTPLDQSMGELLAALTVGGGASDLLLVGDLNVRLAQCTAFNDSPPRASPDHVRPRPPRRVQTVLQWCRDTSLDIVNGTACQTERSRTRMTSFQGGGSAVIDYALASRTRLADGHVALNITPPVPRWSDHAPLIVQWELSEPVSVPEPASRDQLGRTLEDALHTAADTALGPLDTILEDALAAGRRSFHEKVMALYGPVWAAREDATQVWTDGAATGRNEGARAGAGLYYGLHAERNAAYRVTGPQTNNTAEFYALALALQDADLGRTLRVYTDSKLVIRTICYWSVRHAELGWVCANAQIIRHCVSLIRRRIAPVIFVWVKGHSGIAGNEEADCLATAGRSRTPCGQSPKIPTAPSSAPASAQRSTVNVQPPPCRQRTCQRGVHTGCSWQRLQSSTLAKDVLGYCADATRHQRESH